jgi:two-component system sensor histidine kinase ChvG
VAGLFSVRSLELQLLDVQERSMVQQGRLVAAALAAETEALNAEVTRSLIQRLRGRSEARIRIYDARGTVLADSASLTVRRDVEETYPESTQRESVLYRIGVTLWRPVKSVVESFRRSSDSVSRTDSDVTPGTVVHRALEGRYGATLQESAGQRSLTLYSALPVRAGGSGRVIGAVVVSQSTSRILRALWRVRLDIFKVFVISVAVAVVLSLLVSATIARPLIRLRDEADDLLDHRGRLRGTFRGSQRKDEIGDLTRALEKLTARLERHLVFVEGFTADVSHEFKNPLASIRSAAELLPQAENDEEKAQLAATIDKEVARLNRLLNGVREVSKVDAALDTETIAPVSLGPILTEIAQSDRVDLSAASYPLFVNASADRLTQAFTNIVDNALSFSPAEGRVSISLREHDGFAVIRVDDEGPGIPQEHIDRVFDRFFTFRPGGGDERRQHDGLGLAIAHAIVNGYGGSIHAMNREGGGARIEVRLPVAR